ncbi:cbb3-type cytochrome oxidase assembly protein CcoS [Pedobacter gandavensis]|uniref:cbb3-type cytochrome oxidase assembly protein CcoS n=1 Tax=Pedobacter gandavensis TaxID=2679963 RepID=UPI00292E238F|nr:cbb3-type cytochrome oxidase assembly protein CcoS [Pedobacter gandavensis]
MNILYLLIGISILLALISLAAFFWASKSGQNDDTYTPAIRMLFDDEFPDPREEIKSDEDHT